jgi:hypothetical protein
MTLIKIEDMNDIKETVFTIRKKQVKELYDILKKEYTKGWHGWYMVWKQLNEIRNLDLIETSSNYDYKLGHSKGGWTIISFYDRYVRCLKTLEKEGKIEMRQIEKKNQFKVI